MGRLATVWEQCPPGRFASLRFHATGWTVTCFGVKLRTRTEALCEIIHIRAVKSHSPDISLTTGSTAAATIIAACAPADANSAAGHSDSTAAGADGPNIEGAVPIILRINGKYYQLRVDPRTTLLDCLRETVALTGTKKGCDHGQCGACTVHVNGRRVNSCLSLAVMHDGEEITTIEGLGTPDALHPMQAAFRCPRRVPVRILHVRPDHVGRCVAQEPCGPDDAA